MKWIPPLTEEALIFDQLQIELFERYRKLYKEEEDISKQNLQKLTYYHKRH